MRCACGLVCQSNPGCLLVDHGRGAYCVCDGIGVRQTGTLASHILRAEISRALATAETVEGRLRSVDRAIVRANEVIRTRAVREGYQHMGATTVVLVVEPVGGVERPAAVGWVGNCRVYRYRAGVLECLTHDHVVVNGLFRLPPSIRSTRVKSCLRALTRSVGTDEAVAVEWRRFGAADGDAFLICTDGVGGLLTEHQIRAAFAEVTSAESIADRLEAGVIAAGAPASYAFAVCRVG